MWWTRGAAGDEKSGWTKEAIPRATRSTLRNAFTAWTTTTMELTVTVDDPKMYTKPWVAMNKFPMRLQSPDYDVQEQMCIPSEQEQYYKDYGNQASGVAKSPTKQVAATDNKA